MTVSWREKFWFPNYVNELWDSATLLARSEPYVTAAIKLSNAFKPYCSVSSLKKHSQLGLCQQAHFFYVPLTRLTTMMSDHEESPKS